MRLSTINFFLGVGALGVMGMNVVMITINSMSRDNCSDPPDVHTARCGSPTSGFTFHAIEFWTTAIFAVVQSLALVYSPQPSILCENPLLLKFVIAVAIMCSFIPAVFVTINLQDLEVAAHQVEYSNEMTQAFIDLGMVMALARVPLENDDSGMGYQLGFVAAGIGIVLAIVQLCVYNMFGQDSHGNMKGESAAHYVEFSFEIVSSGVTFWFCMDNKWFCDKHANQLLVDGAVSGPPPLQCGGQNRIDALN